MISAEAVARAAFISPCRRYRYNLVRCWNDSGRLLPWIMLNPSTADANVDDPTIRRCMTFADDWGYDGIIVVNLFAYRATDPKALALAYDPFGPLNKEALGHHVLRTADKVMAAWGANRAVDQALAIPKVRALLTSLPLHCLGTTAAGHPRHPLYVKATTKPVPYTLAAA